MSQISFEVLALKQFHDSWNQREQRERERERESVFNRVTCEGCQSDVQNQMTVFSVHKERL